MSLKTISIFGSSQPKEGEPEYQYAYDIAKGLAEKGFRISTGGYSGIMEAASKGSRDAGGSSVGITVKTLKYVPVNDYIDENIVMPDMLSRVKKLIDIADGYIILKGGTGTLVELSWFQGPNV